MQRPLIENPRLKETHTKKEILELGEFFLSLSDNQS